MKLSICISFVATMAMLAVSGGYANGQSVALTAPPSSATGTADAASDPKTARAANRRLAHRVENALARTRGLISARIIVTARDGRITLSGAVNYNEQIALALDAARKVDGVTEVENRIRVTGASL